MKTIKPSRIFSYILRQIYNERRSNWALLAELLIVSCIVWYLVDSSYTMIVRTMEPTGFDHTNCYKVVIDQLDEEAVGYDPSHPDEDDVTLADRLELLDRIRHDEDIEAAAYSMRNQPYDGSLLGGAITRDTVSVSVRVIMCQPDFLKVFRYKSIDGKTTEQLADLLKDRNVLVSQNPYGGEEYLSQWVGKEVFVNYRDTLPRRLVGLVAPVKRFTNEELEQNSIVILPMDDRGILGEGMGYNLSLRVKDSRAKDFEARFREKIKGQRMRVGNHFVSNIVSFDKLKKDSEVEDNQKMRNNIVIIVFLLVNVFLGLLGTFWFRTQHRFPEIGLQKAIGATNTDITLRLLAEGVLLLTIAFVPSLLIDFGMGYNELTEYYRGVTLETDRFIVCAAIAYALMLLIIALGIWFPALRATKANPVDVLRGE